MYEVTEGLTPELINGLWAKNILVIPASEYADGKPRLVLFTNSHMHYEYHVAQRHFESFAAIDPDVVGKGRLGFNSKVYCLRSDATSSWPCAMELLACAMELLA